MKAWLDKNALMIVALLAGLVFIIGQALNTALN